MMAANAEAEAAVRAACAVGDVDGAAQGPVPQVPAGTQTVAGSRFCPLGARQHSSSALQPPHEPPQLHCGGPSKVFSQRPRQGQSLQQSTATFADEAGGGQGPRSHWHWPQGTHAYVCSNGFSQHSSPSAQPPSPGAAQEHGPMSSAPHPPRQAVVAAQQLAMDHLNDFGGVQSRQVPCGRQTLFPRSQPNQRAHARSLG
jgi:hypothetical protein